MASDVFSGVDVQLALFLFDEIELLILLVESKFHFRASMDRFQEVAVSPVYDALEDSNE